MARVYIAVGSNIGPEKNVEEALRLLGEKARITGVSTFYRTEPVSRPGTPHFYNGVVEVETDFRPLELRDGVLRPIEARLGRVRSEDRHAPRTIDLDVIVYADAVFDSGGLKIPDPDIAERAFLACPLFELAPDLVLPGSNIPVKEIAGRFSGHGMEALPGLTRRLRTGLLA